MVFVEFAAVLRGARAHGKGASPSPLHGELQQKWWAIKDLNLGPLPCEGSALTTELIAHKQNLVAEDQDFINR